MERFLLEGGDFVENTFVCEMFQHAFTDTSRALVNLSLRENRHKAEKTPKSTTDTVLLIYTTGLFKAKVQFSFSAGLFQYIIETMNGGVLPNEAEQPLYIKEYVNIVCGRAVSQINNKVGVSSKLTVPYFREEAPVRQQGEVEKIKLYYETEYGDMQILIEYAMNE